LDVSLFLDLSSFFFYCSSSQRTLHSFPTRRSSDLFLPKAETLFATLQRRYTATQTAGGDESRGRRRYSRSTDFSAPPLRTGGRRSEEHTSELQSRGHLVCRLLLEKKKKIHNQQLHA